jgi:hypothetical protein
MQLGIPRNADPLEMPMPVSMSRSYPSSRHSDGGDHRISRNVVGRLLDRDYVCLVPA